MTRSKTWDKGRNDKKTSFGGVNSGNFAFAPSNAAAMLPWDSIAPFGLPVVPDV